MLSANYSRCLGDNGGPVCERRDRCERYRALKTDPKLAYRSLTERLCDDRFQFFLETNDGKSR